METCSICLNEINGVNEQSEIKYTMKCCNNSFHKICISRYSNQKEHTCYFSCPLCRQIQYKLPNFFNELKNNILNGKRMYKDSINLQDINGDTILIYAIKKQLYDIVNKILDITEIDINIQNNDGNTALMIAIKYSCIKIINKILNNKNLNLNIQNELGNTALMYAIYYNNEVINTLLNFKGININIQNGVSNTALMLALLYNINEKTINKILTMDQDINIKNINGYTALHLALKLCSTEIINKILDFNNINLSGSKALTYALKYNKLQSAYKILKLKFFR